MDWQNVSFDWNQARAFLATVEEGSLSAAARALGLTQPTLGRQVAALEETLGVVLFERVGKSLVPTPASFALVEQVRSMHKAAGQISMIASGSSQSLAGRVSVTASDVLSAYVLPNAIKEIRRIAPLLELSIVASNDIQDLQMREADIAIRHVRPEQPELIARLICDSDGYFYAAPEYLEQRGKPQSISDLCNHDFIGLGDNKMMVERLTDFGIPLSEDNFKCGSANGVAAWELARSGLGIVIMGEKIARGFDNMVRLQLDAQPFTFPNWLVTHRELHNSSRIRLVYDHLAEYLKNELG